MTKIESIQNDIRKKCENAAAIIVDDVEKVIRDSATKYYEELPQERLKRYKRRGRLTSMLESANKGGFGYVRYRDDWNYKAAGESGWSNEDIVDVNMNTHTHGFYYMGGTAVWLDSMDKLDENKDSTVRNALIKAGLPIK